MRKESFPINDKIASELAEACAEQLPKPQNIDNRCIYVNFSMVRLQTVLYLPKLIYAKGIAEKTRCRVVAITWRPNESFECMLEAMGIEHLCLEKMLRKNALAGLSAFFKTIGFMLWDGSGEELKKMKIFNLPVGGPLYEDIIRTSEFSTIRSARNKICLRKIFHILWMLFALDDHLKRNKPLYLVADDLGYHEGAQIMIFKRHGAVIRNSSWEAEDRVLFDKKGRIIRRGEMSNLILHKKIKNAEPDIAQKADDMIEKRFSGLNGRDIDRAAFKGKRVLSKEELCEELGLDSNKKNVVIMAHTFTDAVFNYGDIYFRDYYDWLEQTLETAEEVDNVNWILKPHPSRKLYHENVDSIEEMYNRHKRDHIFFFDESVSAKSVQYLADVIITIGSNAGAEFACVGVPVLIVGKPYYAGFGYTIEPHTVSSYKEQLKNIMNVEPLSSKQISTAKMVFYINNTKTEADGSYTDEFACLLLKLYNDLSEESRRRLFESDKGTLENNNKMTEHVIEFIRTHDLKKCEYYMRGFKRGDACD